MSRTITALGGALLLCAPAAARAEAAPESSTIIVTAQRAEEARRDVARRPGGADLVAAADYANRVAVSLRDALAFSPGVYAQPRFGQEVRLSIRGSGISRGFHMRGLTLLQDGVPINLADDNGDFQEFDPQVFETIAVYRGANALRYGGSTLGGAIDATTPTGRSAAGAELRVDGGAFDTLRGKAAYGFVTARGDAYAALTADRSDGDRDHARRDALRFTGNAAIRLSEAIETRLYASVNRIDQRLPGSLTRAQALSTPRLSLPANLSGDQQRNIDSLRLQSRTTVALAGGQLAFGGYYNAKELYHPIFQVIDQQTSDRGAFASLDWAGETVALTLGATARFGTTAARQYVNLRGRRGALTAEGRQVARTINSYGELRLTPGAGLTLIAGGIHTSGRRRVANRLAPANSDAAAYNRFAPKIGAIWDAGGVQVYANYSRSVELPGFGELVQQPVAGFVPLDPQRAWTIEAGTRGKRGFASWDVSIYRADIKGELLQFATGPDIPAATFNAGATRHQGIEAGLELAPARWLRLRQVYQYNDFRFRRDAQYGANWLPVVPRQQLRAEIRVGSEALSVAPVVEWVPKGAFVDYRNTVRAPGYALLGLGASATLAAGVTAFLDARNLTAKRAIGDMSAVILATPATVAYYPVERRGVYGGLRARF